MVYYYFYLIKWLLFLFIALFYKTIKHRDNNFLFSIFYAAKPRIF
jgi:hypothetical protein